MTSLPAKRVGRPKGEDKVYFRRYVTPAVADSLDRAIESGVFDRCAPVKFDEMAAIPKPEVKPLPVDSEVADLKRRLHEAQLVQDSLSEEIAGLKTNLAIKEVEYQDLAMLDLEPKGKLGWKMFFDLKGGRNKSEHDQT